MGSSLPFVSILAPVSRGDWLLPGFAGTGDGSLALIVLRSPAHPRRWSNGTGRSKLGVDEDAGVGVVGLAAAGAGSGAATVMPTSASSFGQGRPSRRIGMATSRWDRTTTLHFSYTFSMYSTRGPSHKSTNSSFFLLCSCSISDLHFVLSGWFCVIKNFFRF